MTREQMESRRMKALELFRQGKTAYRVAQRLRVSRTSSSRWFHRWKDGESLARRKAPGRPSRLTNAQTDVLRHLVQTSPAMTDVQVASLIEAHTGVRYNRDHAGRLKAVWLGIRSQLNPRVAA